MKIWVYGTPRVKIRRKIMLKRDKPRVWDIIDERVNCVKSCKPPWDNSGRAIGKQLRCMLRFEFHVGQCKTTVRALAAWLSILYNIKKSCLGSRPFAELVSL